MLTTSEHYQRHDGTLAKLYQDTRTADGATWIVTVLNRDGLGDDLLWAPGARSAAGDLEAARRALAENGYARITPHIRMPKRAPRWTSRNWAQLINRATTAATLCGEPLTDRDVLLRDTEALERDGRGCQECIRIALDVLATRKGKR